MADPRVHEWKTVSRDVAQVVVGDGDRGACCLHVGKFIGGEYAQRYARQEAVDNNSLASGRIVCSQRAWDPFPAPGIVHARRQP